jgi:hypothetical protein
MSKTAVKLIGFDLTFSKGISIDDYFHWLVASEGKPISANGYTNYIFSDLHENYIVGLVICYKGDKKILATRMENNQLNIDKIELKSNQESTQATIFCIEPTSKTGMFYSYHGGVSRSNFASILGKIHDKIKASKIKEKIKELSKLGKPSKKNKYDATEDYNGSFVFNVRVQTHDIDTLISQFSEVSDVEITMGPAIQLSSELRPLQNVLNSVSTKFNLSRESDTAQKKSAIRDIWNTLTNKQAARTLKMSGKAMTGVQLDRQIGENLEHYDQIYLDDYIDLLPETKWSDYKDSEAIIRLIKKVKSRPLVIPEPKEVSNWKILPNKKDYGKQTKEHAIED